jgi:hypothetical protein
MRNKIKKLSARQNKKTTFLFLKKTNETLSSENFPHHHQIRNPTCAVPER